MKKKREQTKVSLSTACSCGRNEQCPKLDAEPRDGYTPFGTREWVEAFYADHGFYPSLGGSSGGDLLRVHPVKEPKVRVKAALQANGWYKRVVSTGVIQMC